MCIMLYTFIKKIKFYIDNKIFPYQVIFKYSQSTIHHAPEHQSPCSGKKKSIFYQIIPYHSYQNSINEIYMCKNK